MAYNEKQPMIKDSLWWHNNNIMLICHNAIKQSTENQANKLEFDTKGPILVIDLSDILDTSTCDLKWTDLISTFNIIFLTASESDGKNS